MIEPAELRAAAQKAFPADRLIPDRDEAWRHVAEMGWLHLELSEEMGGLALGRNAAATLHYEMGRVLSAAPLIPASLALQAIEASPCMNDRRVWIDRMCAGEYMPVPVLSSKLRCDGNVALHGTVSGVLEADMATHILVGIPDLHVLVPLDAPEVMVVERPVWDRSRRMFDVTLEGYPCRSNLIVAQGDESRKLEYAIAASAQLAIAADSLGGASAVLEQTIDYLKVRRQFDRPLAMFQALKHRCADLKGLVAAAEALLWSRARDATSAIIECGALKAHATNVFRIVAEEAIQLHGGIGLTDEHHCHLYMKRAMLNAQLFDATDVWLERRGRFSLAETAR